MISLGRKKGRGTEEDKRDERKGIRRREGRWKEGGRERKGGLRGANKRVEGRMEGRE